MLGPGRTIKGGLCRPVVSNNNNSKVTPVRRVYLNALLIAAPSITDKLPIINVLRSKLIDNNNNNNNKCNNNSHANVTHINNVNIKSSNNNNNKTTQLNNRNTNSNISKFVISDYDDPELTPTDFVANSVDLSTDDSQSLILDSMNYGYHTITADIGIGDTRMSQSILADSGSTASAITFEALERLGVEYTTQTMDIEIHKKVARNYSGFATTLEVTYNNKTTKVGFLIFNFIDNDSGILLSMHDSFRVGVNHLHTVTERMALEMTRQTRIALRTKKNIPEGKQTIPTPPDIDQLLKINEDIPADGIVTFAADGLLIEFKKEFLDKYGKPDIPDTSHPRVYMSQRMSKLDDEITLQIEAWLKSNVVSEVKLSSAERKYCSPLVPVSVNGKKLRVCSDFRNLNEYIVVSANNIPLPQDAVHWAAGHQVLTSLDMKAGYFQMPLHPSSRKYARFFWKGKYYQYNRVAFGINSAPTYFHGMIAMQFADDPNVFVYFDNIYVGSRVDNAVEVLTRVLKRCNELNIKLNMSKLELFQDFIDVLGFRVGFNKISIHPKRIQTIMGLSLPKDRKQMQSFIGLITYNRNHIVHCNVLLDLLHKEAARLTTPSAKVVWTEELTKAFESCRKGLIHAVTMHTMYPDETAHIFSDASGRGIGGFLCVFRNDECIPIDFFSEYLSHHQRSWNTTHREYAAAVKSCEHWQQLLYGRKVVIHVDHKALLAGAQWALESPLFARWSRVLALLRTEFMWLPGEENVVADALSRLERDDGVAKEDPYFTTEEAQQMINESKSVAKRVIAHINSLNINAVEARPPPMAADVNRKKQAVLLEGVKVDDLPLTPVINQGRLCNYLKPVHHGPKNVTYDAVSLDYREKVPQGWIPTQDTLKEWCKLAHLETGHGGVVAVTAYLLHKQRLPPRASATINKVTADCKLCANLKRRNAVQWDEMKVEAQFPLEKIQMDLFHPITGATAIVIVDVYSGYAWTKVLADNSGAEVGNALLEYISIFGVPNSIHTDQGPEFVNAGLRFLSEVIPFFHTVSVANRPVGRGIVEGRIRLIKDKLTLALAEIKNWRLGLTLATSALNRADRANKPSPEYLMFGRRSHWLAAHLSHDFNKMNWNDYINDRVAELNKRPLSEKDVKLQDKISVNDVVYTRNLTYSGGEDFYFYGPYIVTSVDVRNNLYIKNPFGLSHPMPVHYSTCYRHGDANAAVESGLFDNPKIHAVIAHSIANGTLYLRILLWGYRTDESVWIKHSTIKELKIVEEYCQQNNLLKHK